MKYRKRPVVIEATQWWAPGDHPAVIHPLPAEAQSSLAAQLATGTVAAPEKLGVIRTLEGWMLVTPGDYIIRGVHGEHYACKPDIFEKTYEPA